MMQSLASSGIAALATFLVLRIWLGYGFRKPMDVANHRSLHVGAVPRIGGIAMLMGCVASFLAAPASHAAPLVALLAAGLSIVSAVDDWHSLPVAVRLAAHFAAAAMTVHMLPIPIALGATLFIVWMTNLYNFMDGADGLAGGMAMIGFGAYGLAAMSAMSPLAPDCLAIGGAAVAFLVFNFPPARVFMGDAGSIPLGFLAGAFGVLGWREGVWPVWFPVLVFSPFIVDATVTLWRRLLRGERIWQAHREHCYQRLVLAGWSHRKLALVAWVLMAAVALTALALRNASSALQVGALLSWALIYVGAWRVVNRRTVDHKPSQA